MIAWQFSRKKDRSARWYIIGIIVILSLVVYGIITQMFIMSVVVVLFAGTVLLIDNNSSDIVAVEINQNDISIDETNYSFKEFSSFAIVEVQGSPLLLRLYPKKKFGTVIEIPLSPEVEIESIRTILAASLVENTDAEFTTTDALAHLTKI